LHTLLDLRGAIPAFIHISDGKLHDVNVPDILPVEAGALASSRCFAVHLPTDPVGLGLREEPRFHAPCSPIALGLNCPTSLTN
jgi:hypothetical protein